MSKSSENQLLACHRELQMAQAELEDQGDKTRLWPLQKRAPDGTDTVDFSKADPDCERCDGKGATGHRLVPVDGRVLEIPVICRCIYARGGVALHLLRDKLKPPAKKFKRKRRRRFKRNRISSVKKRTPDGDPRAD